MSAFAFWTAIWQGLLISILCLGVYTAFKIVRFPDLSCDGTFPLGASVAGVLIISGVNPFLATFLALMSGAVAGCITAALNVKFKIPAIVSSILVMTGLYSINMIMMKKPVLSLSKEKTVFSGVEQLLNSNNSIIHKLQLKNLIYPFIFFCIVILIKKLLDWFLNTELGLSLRVTGDNAKMARIMAINTKKMVIIGLAISNGLIALSGALFAQIQKFSDVNLGFGMIIVGLASVFIGEAIENSTKKIKKVLNTTSMVILGSILYKLAIALSYEVGLSTDYFNLVTALIVTIALLIPSVRSDMFAIIRSNGR